MIYGVVHLVTTCFVQPKEAGKIKPPCAALQYVGHLTMLPSPSPSPDLMLQEDQQCQMKGSHSAISCSVVTRLIHSVSWTVIDAL